VEGVTRDFDDHRKRALSPSPTNRSNGDFTAGTDLIIPDIHLQWNRADRIIQQENCDRVWLAAG